VNGSRGAARWLALLASIPLAGAGCKREPKPLEPPDPAVEAVDLSWSDYRRDETASDPGFFRLLRTWEYRLTLSPDGRFRYAWRNVRETPESWREIVGDWQPDRGRWTLKPDLGSASLEVGGFEEGEWPGLSWGSQVIVASESVPPKIPKSGGVEVYLVPELDPVTGRIFGMMSVDPLPPELGGLAEEHPELRRTLRQIRFIPDPRLGFKYPDAEVVVVRERD
jgi:hypothetical protein